MRLCRTNFRAVGRGDGAAGTTARTGQSRMRLPPATEPGPLAAQSRLGERSGLQGSPDRFVHRGEDTWRGARSA
jgi:hypothetical protein